MSGTREPGLLDFSGPLHVVTARLVAGGGLDDLFEGGPEPQLLQRVVQPARGDAEVGLVGGNVVDPVVLARQDDVHVLKQGDPPWQAEVGVGPLVELWMLIKHSKVSSM